MGSSKKADFKNQAYERHPFLMSVEETAQQLGTNLETGLTDAKVQELQQRYGRNQLEGDSGIKWYALLGKQISNAMIMVRTFFFLTASSSYVSSGVFGTSMFPFGLR